MWCLFLRLSRTSEMGGLFPILRYHNRKPCFLTIQLADYKAINSYNQFQGTTTYNNCCCGFPYDLFRNYKAINSYNPIQGAIFTL